MELTFLAAANRTRLAKTFQRVNGGIQVTPYPMVKCFVSVGRRIRTLGQALPLLEAHAKAGHCLLKGSLTRRLLGEPRAGHTVREAPTDWFALDLDFEAGFESIDAFLDALGLGATTYILHHSSSAGLTAKPGLRAHVFLALAEPVAPSALKLWLRYQNLCVPGLRDQIRLCANGMTLRWPLDVTSAQNDKLIFIADPIARGVDDPLAGRRFEFHERGAERLALSTEYLTPGGIQQKTDALVAALRAQAGHPVRSARYVALPSGPRLLANPEPAAVSGVRRARGFVYLNLNGGDSWGYYFPQTNPEILYSFKGEPPVRLADIAPNLYARLRPVDPFQEIALRPVPAT